MFPLGTVLVPTAVLPLHIFEPRYQALMDDLTVGAELGVVLISRGSEVGGGDVRVPVGTVARLLEATRLSDGRWVIAVAGTRRFRVQRWLPDAPYPVADVADLEEDLTWDDADAGLLADAGRRVRRALALAAELGEAPAPVTFELADDPVVAAWQLAAMAPVGPMDRQQLLEIDAPANRLRTVARLADDIGEVLALRLSGGQ